MVNNIKSFDERIKELVSQGKEQGYLTYEQLAKKTIDLDLDSNALDELYNVLTENEIEVRSEDENDSSTPWLDFDEKNAGFVISADDEDAFAKCIDI